MPGWITVPLGEMYNSVFFIDTAYAIHGDTSVPLQPVSHGCVRIPMDIAAFFHTLIAIPARRSTSAADARYRSHRPVPPGRRSRRVGGEEHCPGRSPRRRRTRMTRPDTPAG
jgi:hypothetical protein